MVGGVNSSRVTNETCARIVKMRGSYSYESQCQPRYTYICCDSYYNSASFNFEAFFLMVFDISICVLLPPREVYFVVEK